jgi:CDP-diacylglycerol--glycerol-3-phosphate 3-phosphatidyltransferase
LISFLPNRFKEIVGLLHTKVYIFDDSVIISGANLNNDYFVNRQDRYILFKNQPKMANYFQGLFKIISSNTSTHSDLIKYLDDQIENNSSSSKSSKTFLLPLLQLPDFQINQEQESMNYIFKHLHPSNYSIFLSSGYFNITKTYRNLIRKFLNNSKSNAHILIASPQANGFFNSKGISRHIPNAYNYLTIKFLNHLSSKEFSKLSLLEYIRSNWTFHAKGLWLFPDQPVSRNHPLIFTIGSSNFGYRSEERDLENQILIISADPKVEGKIKKNVQDLFFSSYNSKIIEIGNLSSQDRTISLFWKGIVKLFQKML